MWKSWLIGDYDNKRFGKGIVRRLAVVLGSAALLLPLAEPVGRRTGAVARYLLAMAATAMAIPAQAQTTCAEPNFGTRRQIWTGTLTVAEGRGGSLSFGHGYSTFLDNTGGDLSNKNFDIGVNSYVITQAFLFVSTNREQDNVITFSLASNLTAAEVAALRLHVCDTAYDFSEANQSSAQFSHTWVLFLDWSSESTRTLYLSLPANNAATGLPTISGTAEFGEALTAATSNIADTDGLPTSFQYQWLRENQDGTGQEPIGGATSNTYTLAFEDVGKKVKVRVNFTDMLNGMEEVTSAAYPATGTVSGLGVVSVDAASVSADEGETLTYTMTLRNQPTGNVTITPASDDSGALALSPASVTFTTTNWDTAQTVSVTAVQDADGADEMVTISHGVTGYGAVTAAAAVTVTVDDDDVPGVSVTPPASSSLSEGSGTTITYTMKLDTEPTGNVTIAPDSGVDSNAVSVSPASLIFTTSNWNTARTVSVTAMEDFDATNEMVSISHAVSGADYASVTADSVNVIVTDNDTRSVTVSGSPLTINEGGTGTYSVVLTSQPTDAVTVMPSRSGDPDVTVSAALTFSTSNWNTPQTVTVSAAEDNDASNDTATITHAVSGADYASVTAASIDVTVTDNDTRGITLSEPDLSLSLNEGSSVTYTVVLNTQPTGEVTVTPSRSGDPDVTVSDALTFFTTNWNTPQTVTVSAAEDNDADNDTATIAHAVSGADYASITAASIDVTVTDNDTRGITLSEPDLSLSLNEGSSVTYTVVLNIQPTDAVTVTPSRSSGDMDVTVSAALTFSTSNWDTPQTVTVSAAEDNDASNDTATITHDVSGADYDTLTADPVQVTVNDNEAVDDTAPMVIFILRQAPIASPTNGDSLMWRVTFSEVVENVDATDFTVSGSTATVTNVEPVGGEPHAYDVTVSGGDLAGLDGTVTLGFASGQDIGDAAGHALAITPPTGSSNNSYLVDNTAPMLTYTPPTVLTVGTAITVIAPTTTDDDIARTSATGLPAGLTITTTGAISGTPTTASPATSVVVVTVTDNAGNQTEVRLAFPAVREAVQPGVSVAPTTSLSLNEGETSAYTLVLETPPPGNVTITPTSGDSGAVSMSPASLTFTPSNWDTPRTVTVTGVNDADTDDETVTIRHSVSGYGAVTAAAAVTVTVNDDDTTQGEAEASEAAKEVADAVLEEVALPDVLQQVTARTTEVIASRLNTIASGSLPTAPLTLSLDDVVADTVAFLYGERSHLKDSSLEWQQALAGRSFAFPLSGLNLARGGSAGGQEHPFSSLVVWGGADYSSYGNTIEHTDVDGNGFSGVIGMDLQPSPQLTTGLAITTSRWGLDYATNTNATTTNDATAEGTYEIGVTMLHPYVNWWATEQLSLWATFGYGRGEVEQDPEGDDTTTRTDALTSWAGGVRFEVVPAMDPLSGGEGAPFGLAFKADGATSSFLDTQVQLARLAAEVSRSFAVENGLLTTALELGWRLHSVSDKDGLDGLQQRIADKKDSGGAELAGRLNWRDSEGRLSATVDTRVVLGGGDRKEWGMGGHLRFTPSRRDGEGLSLTLQPSFGVTGTRLDELWSLSGDGDLAINNDPPGARLDAELAYGVPLGDGLLTPYTEVAWEEGGSIYGAGLRYGLNRSLELDLKGARHRHTDGNPENRLLLEVHSRL